MSEDKKLRFDINKAGEHVKESKSVLGFLGNSTAFLAKGTFNVGMAVLEQLPEAVNKAVERQKK